MRAAPPVSVPCEAGAVWRAAQAWLHAAAAVALAAWAGQHLGLGAAAWGLAAVLGALAFALGWALAKAEPVQLRWTGEQWTLRLPGQDETPIPPPAVAMDTGAWMLLKAGAPTRHGAWLAVARGSAGAGWLPLRAAVYSAAPEPTLPSAQERTLS